MLRLLQAVYALKINSNKNLKKVFVGQIKDCVNVDVFSMLGLTHFLNVFFNLNVYVRNCANAHVSVNIINKKLFLLVSC